MTPSPNEWRTSGVLPVSLKGIKPHHVETDHRCRDYAVEHLDGGKRKKVKGRVLRSPRPSEAYVPVYHDVEREGVTSTRRRAPGTYHPGQFREAKPNAPVASVNTTTGATVEAQDSNAGSCGNQDDSGGSGGTSSGAGSGGGDGISDDDPDPPALKQSGSSAYLAAPYPTSFCKLVHPIETSVAADLNTEILPPSRTSNTRTHRLCHYTLASDAMRVCVRTEHDRNYRVSVLDAVQETES